MPRTFGKNLFRQVPHRQADHDDEERIDIDIFQRNSHALRFEQLAQERQKADRLKARKAQKRTEETESAENEERRVKKVRGKEGGEGNGVQRCKNHKARQRTGSASTDHTPEEVANSRVNDDKGKAKAAVVNLDSSEEDIQNGPAMPIRPSPRNETTQQQPSSPEMQSISAWASPTRVPRSKNARLRASHSVDVDADGSDEDGEYLRNLLKQVEAGRKKGASAEASGTPEVQPHHASASLPIPPSPVKTRDGEQDKATPGPDNPVMKILVDSRIPNSKPLMLLRRYQQDMKAVKEAWCRVNEVDGMRIKSMFLTWRNSKVFDSATCKVLGIQVTNDGRTFLKDRNGQRKFLEDGQVYMEMATDEIMAKDSAERAAKSDARRARLRPNADEFGGDARPEVKVDSVKLILRAKDYDDYKLKVKPHTKIAQVIEVFQKQQKVDSAKKISIYFEGDVLDPNITISETDLESGFVADVHIK